METPNLAALDLVPVAWQWSWGTGGGPIPTLIPTLILHLMPCTLMPLVGVRLQEYFPDAKQSANYFNNSRGEAEASYLICNRNSVLVLQGHSCSISRFIFQSVSFSILLDFGRSRHIYTTLH